MYKRRLLYKRGVPNRASLPTGLAADTVQHCWVGSVGVVGPEPVELGFDLLVWAACTGRGTWGGTCLKVEEESRVRKFE